MTTKIDLKTYGTSLLQLKNCETDNKTQKAVKNSLNDLIESSTGRTSTRLEIAAVCCYTTALGLGVAGFFMPVLFIPALTIFLIGLASQCSGLIIKANLEEKQLWKQLDENSKLPDFFTELLNGLENLPKDIGVPAAAKCQDYLQSRFESIQ